MRYRCEILNHGIDGYEVWLHGVTRGALGINQTNTYHKYYCKYIYIYIIYIYIYTGCAKKERHFKYINEIANN